MGLTFSPKNTKTLSRYRDSLVFKHRLLRLYNLLNVQDDNVHTMVLIKLVKLLTPITGTKHVCYYQVYGYDEVRWKMKVALQKAISYLYYDKPKKDKTDYLHKAFSSFIEFKAYVNNAHRYYGVMTKR